MLEIHGKIHDRYTLEFKVGYSRYSPSAAVSDFMMDTWIFIPDSLYINAKTYPKSNFYRDFRALVRLITPVYTLEEVADEEAFLNEQLALPYADRNIVFVIGQGSNCADWWGLSSPIILIIAPRSVIG